MKGGYLNGEWNDNLVDGENPVVTQYWLSHYLGPLTCSLCGNYGIIDTRSTVITASGDPAGRLNFCICPNGQQMRAYGLDVEISHLTRWPIQAAKTLGQVAYEADVVRVPNYLDNGLPRVPWAQLPAEAQKTWEASAW